MLEWRHEIPVDVPDANIPNIPPPIVLGDASEVIERWAKLYRFAGPAAN